MEILSNVVWVTVALVLCGVWFVQSRCLRGASLRSGSGAQLIALIVLSVILLPVISVSDDLQASLNPAEVERCCARSDQHPPLLDPPPPAPAGLAAIVALFLLDPPRAAAFLDLPAPSVCEQCSHVRARACRPPPLA